MDDLPEPLRDLAAAFGDPTSLTRRAYSCVEPAFDHNDPAEQVAELPSTNGICTARGLARLYAALIGSVDGYRILNSATLIAATTAHTEGPDLVARLPFHVGLGVGLPTPDAGWHSKSAFGFGGLGGSLGYADPESGIAFGYVMNNIRNSPAADDPAAALVAALRSSLT